MSPMRLRIAAGTIASGIFMAGFIAGTSFPSTLGVRAQSGAGAGTGTGTGTPARVFELRTYTTNEGKLPNLHARFRDHTMRIFEVHGMTNIGYWTPLDAPDSERTLVYLLAHPDRESAVASWQAFRDDPEWQEVSAASQVDGRIVSQVESVLMEPTDYSPIR